MKALTPGDWLLLYVLIALTAILVAGIVKFHLEAQRLRRFERDLREQRRPTLPPTRPLSAKDALALRQLHAHDQEEAEAHEARQ